MGRWYRLDSAAKVFPAAIAENNSTVFRGAVILTEPVDPDKLQQAVDIVLKRFPTFAARLGNGLFWNYLYENNSRLMVAKEQTYPSALIDPEANNGFMIKIL
ncbi:MAG: alcohol acetyltransferase, partial [Limnochordia bacterium]